MKFSACLLLLILAGCSREPSSPAPAKTTSVNGSVFIVNKIGTSLKLGLVPVYVVSESQYLANTINLGRMLESTARDLAQSELSAHNASRQLFDIGVAKLIESFHMERPTTKTDADGGFQIEIQSSETMVVVALATRESDEIEKLLWAEKIIPNGKKQKIMLSNDNLIESIDVIAPNTTEAFIREAADIRKKKADAESKRLAEKRQKEKEELALAEAARQRAIDDQKQQEAKRVADIAFRTLEWNQRQADKGDAYGQYRMGMRYMVGDGVIKNESLGMEWLRKAAAQGQEEAKKEIEKSNQITASK